MKKFFFLFFFWVISLLYSQNQTSLAILGFINKGEKSDEFYNSIISESLSSFMSKLRELKVLPYSEVSKIVSREGLLEGEEINVEKAMDIGIILGAQQILVGDYFVNKKKKEIEVNFYLYNVTTGELKLKRSYKGRTDLDFFDTMDKMISIVGSFLLSRPLLLGKLILEIDSDDEYLLYINDSFQRKIARNSPFSESVLAEESFTLSLKKEKTTQEVYRDNIFVKNGEKYYLKYIPSGIAKINAKGFEDFEIYTNEVFYGIFNDNGRIISNLQVGKEYGIYLKKGNIISEKKTIKVEEGKIYNLEFNINKTIRNGTLTGWNIAGYTMLGIGVIGLGGGYYFNMEAKKYYDLSIQKYQEYKTATSDFDKKWNEYETSYNNFNTMLLARNISYIGGGILLGTGLILSFLPSFGKENFKIEIQPNYIELGWRF